MHQPRPEYPRPQFVRDEWINLNGPWSYTFDCGKSGAQRGFANSKGFDDEILVPFCPESALSGVNHRDFIEEMWYQRHFAVPPEWDGRRILLHFGAVDYESEVFIDGRLVGRHWGGTSSFTHEITSYVKPGETHNLVVHVRDETRSGVQPCGKQCPDYASHGCLYTRTTGIWQTVWLEPVAFHGLQNAHIIPDLDGAQFIVIPRFHAMQSDLRFRVTLRAGDKTLTRVESTATSGRPYHIPIPNPRPWSPTDPFLYDLTFEVLQEGTVIDRVDSYAGLRKIHIAGDQLYLNNEPLYLRMVLDQGFYPDGIWTAPSDASLRRDIELAMQAGFNGARLHQKVFEERFHYWADRMGYLTWGESSDWGFDHKDEVGARNFMSEWREIVVRDRNHPSIIAWTPFNETGDVGDGRQHHRLQEDIYELTRALDPTRPVNDASGYTHVKTDLWTVHAYHQDPESLHEYLQLREGKVLHRNPEHEVEYAGQPYIVDEFGGIKWISDPSHRHSPASWGYGQEPQTLEEFYARLESLVNVILNLKHVRGYCYTQLTDVEQEQNGIYNYDRSPKFDMQRIAAIFSRQPDRYSI